MATASASTRRPGDSPTNRSSRTYEPKPLNRQEAELRASGGILTAGRREFLASLASEPRIEWPGPEEQRRLTVTEQILWAHRVDRRVPVSVGETVLVAADLLPASDGTAPFAIHTFREITGGAIYPRQAAIANDHFVFTGRRADDRQTAISRDFAAAEELRPPWFATPGDGIFHFYFPEQGLVSAGRRGSGGRQPQPRLRRLRRARHRHRIDRTRLRLGHRQRFSDSGTGPPGGAERGTPSVVLGQGHRAGAHLAVERGRRAAPRWNSSIRAGALPIAWRNTICNMMAEAEAWNGIFAFDEVTSGFYESRGIRDLPYPRLASGPSARFAEEEVFDLATVEPLVALPAAPGNAHPATRVAESRLGFDRAYIGSCTNGSYEDLLSAAQVVRAARDQGHDRAREKFVIFPGSGGVRKQIEQGEPRLGGEPIASVLRSVGGEIRASWCGPCFGQGEDALQPGMRAITSFNRNWENRMGRGGEGYLASPAVVAASALLGYIAPPSELGLRWDPERFGG